MSLRDAVWRSICVHDAKFSDNGIFLIQFILYTVRFILFLLFINRDLPQDKVESSAMQLLNHSQRIFPVRTL